MLKRPVIALVTAYNEEKTIGNVLDVLKKCSNVDRIQVVDDGSHDATRQIAEQKEVPVISLPNRIPVGKAIIHHLSNIPEKDCTLLWCDADLINLAVEHIESILKNLEDNDVAMSIGGKDHFAFLPFPISAIFPLWIINKSLPIFTFFNFYLGGERAIHRQVFEKAIRYSKLSSGYGIIILLNLYCKKFDKGYVATFLPKLTHREKYQKWGWKGFLEIIPQMFQFFIAHIKIRIMLYRDYSKRR